MHMVMNITLCCGCFLVADVEVSGLSWFDLRFNLQNKNKNYSSRNNLSDAELSNIVI